MVKKIYSKHYSPRRFHQNIRNILGRRLFIPVFAGLLAAALITGLFFHKPLPKTQKQDASKSLVFQRQLIGKNQYVGEIKGVMKTALAANRDGGQVTVSRGKSNIEFTIPIQDPTLNSENVGILQASDVSFASKDKIISAKYNLLPNGIKEEIIMNKIPRENLLPIKMKTENLRIKINPDGIPVFYDPSGTYQFHFERPYVRDGAGQISYGVRYRFVSNGNKDKNLFRISNGVQAQQKLFGNNVALPADNYEFAVEIDPDWLHDPKRVLPITIDPTVVYNTTSEFNAGKYNRSVGDTSQNNGAPATELSSDINTNGLWHFNETANGTCSGGADACDSSSFGRHAVASGATISSTVSPLGSARVFNGTNQDLVIQNGSAYAFDYNYLYTIEAWIKTGSTAEQKIYSNMDSNAPNRGIELWISNVDSGKLAFYAVNNWNTSLAINVAGSTFIADNQWHHVAVTYGGTGTAAGVKLYVDGVEETKTVHLDTLGTNTTISSIFPRIGSRNHAGFFFNGAIDEMRIYANVLSAGTIASDAAKGPAIQSNYQELPADRYTAGLWHLNEASGNALDSSGNGNTGTPTGTTVVAGRAGLGNARSFNGAEYINVPAAQGSSLDIDANPVTLEAWVKPNSTALQRIVFRGPNGTTGYGISINVNANNTFNVGNAGGGNFDSVTTVTTGTWYHVAGVINGANSALYINGNLESTGTVNVLANGGTALVIGAGRNAADNGYDSFFNGVIDEVKVSNVARTAEEIKLDAQRRPSSTYTSDVVDLGRVTSWNSLNWTELGVTTGDGETSVSSTGLIAQWNFNETSGTTAVSGGTCGTSCNGTLVNFASTGSQDAAPSTGWTADNKRWGAGALMFDNADDYVTANSSLLSAGGTKTVEAWIKSNVAQGLIFASYDGTNGYELYTNTTTGNLALWTPAGGVLDSGKSVTDGIWHHVVGTWDGINGNLYIDGRFIKSGARTIVTSSSNQGVIGAQCTGACPTGATWFYDGVIDSVRVYSRALTASEILSNYNAGNVELQTRVGETTNPDDGTWEAWRPTTNETQIDSFDSNTNADGIDTVYLGDSGTNQTWIKKNNVTPTASDTTSTDGRVAIGTAGKGDVTHAFQPTVIKDGSTYKMWYSGSDGTSGRVYYATSADGLSWSKNNNIIEAPSDTTGTNGRLPLGSTAGRGDISNIQYPSVIKDGSTYKMWYSGNDATSWRIYYATSSDGLTWTKSDNTIPTASDTSSTNGRIPLGTNGKGDDAGTLAPSVIKDGSTYKMWYAGNDGTNWRIYYATSSDGLTWTKYDNTIPAASDDVSTNGRIPLGTGADSTHAYVPRVIKDGNTYKMWYAMHNGTNVRMGYAVSTDGLTWKKYNNSAMGVSDTYGTYGRIGLGNTGRGDQTHAFGGWVIKDNGVYKMWYFGNNGTNYMIYYASMAPLPLRQDRDTNIKIEGTASEKFTTGVSNSDAGTLGLWHLDETGGTGAYIQDSSIYNDDFTPSGTTVVEGLKGKARNFNGSSDYIEQAVSGGTTLDIVGKPVTLSAWIYPTAVTGSHYIVARYLAYGMYLDSAQKLHCGGVGLSNWTSTATVALNQWTYVTCIINGASSQAYINGVSDSTGTLTAQTTNSNPLDIGVLNNTSGPGYSGYFIGSIDEVQISQTDRIAEEVAEAYRMGRGHYINRTISSTDLSGKSTLPFYIAADRPGTYLQATVGESAYSNYQPDDNTIGLWHLEETVGSLKDSGTFGNYVTSTASTSVNGKYGLGRYFDGATAYLEKASAAGSSLDIVGVPVTLSAWIKPAAMTGNEYIVAKNSAYGMYTDSASKLHCGGVGLNNWASNITLVLNHWYYVTCIINGASSKMYINGIYDSTGSLTAQTSNANRFDIGAYYTTAYSGFFNGAIDEVSVSNIARSASEIRQAFEVGSRSHNITIDFAAKLDSGNLISNSGDVSFTVDATAYGLNSKGSKIFSGDKIIVRENYNGTEYIAQGTVSTVNESTGAVTLTSWDGTSSFPPSVGFSANATAFKWQREYWNIISPMDDQLNSTTNLTLRLLDGNEGRNIWIDDLESGTDYLTDPAGSTITSSTGKKYFQYRVVQHSSDENVSASLTSVTLDYVQNLAPNAPTLDDPTDTQTNRSVTPALKTTATDGNSDNLKYKIELCDNLAMTTNCQTFDQTLSSTGWSGMNADGNTTYTSGTQATYTISTPLSATTTYYWRSYAIDPSGLNTWSATQSPPHSFTTSNPPSTPSTPYAEGAANPTGVSDITPEFSAIQSDPDGDAANYFQIQVNTQSDFLGTSMWDSGKTSMTSTANGVRSPNIPYAGSAIPLDGAGTTYYWRIKFWDVNGTASSYTAAQSFTMSVKPNVPTLDAPSNSAVDQSIALSLSTTATDNDSDNLKYKIQICTNSAMTTNCQTYDETLSQTGWSGQNADSNTTYTSGTQATYNVQSPLAPAATYYWRSYAIDPSGSNTWSLTQGAPNSFTTTSTNYPTSCTIEKAGNNSSLTIKWNDNSVNEVNYEIQKNTDNGGFSLLQTLPQSSSNYQDSAVANGHSYQYRVAAIFAGPNYSEWCTTSNITLGQGTLHMQGVNLR